MEIRPGTRALITGASRGIGRAIATELAARGAVCGLAARSEAELEALAAALPGEHRALPCDVASRESVRAATEGFVAATGGLTTVYPGEIATSLHDHQKDSLPPWYRGGDRAAPPDALARNVVAAVQRDARALHHPPLVRAMGALHAISPRAADAVLRRMRGTSAAPRRD